MIDFFDSLKIPSPSVNHLLHYISLSRFPVSDFHQYPMSKKGVASDLGVGYGGGGMEAASLHSYSALQLIDVGSRKVQYPTGDLMAEGMDWTDGAKKSKDGRRKDEDAEAAAAAAANQTKMSRDNGNGRLIGFFFLGANRTENRSCKAL